MSEKINPEYYKNKKIETNEAIVSQQSPMAVIGGYQREVLKYFMRFGEKHGGSLDATLTDVSKGHWFAEKLIQYLNDLKKNGDTIESVNNIAELFKKDK
jgi:hypothetical protein